MAILPKTFESLEKWAGWAIDTENARWTKRIDHRLSRRRTGWKRGSNDERVP